MRGDRPIFFLYILFQIVFTPHARGSTPAKGNLTNQKQVYPACAGIDLFVMAFPPFYSRLPRMRGDRPTKRARDLKGRGFTPHARGSTPDHQKAVSGAGGLPRMRGDRPT